MRLIGSITMLAVSAALASILRLTDFSLSKTDDTSLLESGEACPRLCDNSIAESFTSFSNIRALALCDQHMLLEISTDEDRSDYGDSAPLRACGLYDQTKTPQGLGTRDALPVASASLCVNEASLYNVSLDVAMAGDGMNFTFVTADALAQISTYMSASCDLKQTFSYGLGAIVGVFSGASIDNGGTVSAVLSKAIALTNNSDTGAPESMYIQRCTTEGTSSHIFGVAVNNAGDFDWVKSAITSWSNGVCLNSSSLTSANHSTLPDVAIYEYSHPPTNLTTILPSNITITSIPDSHTSTSAVTTIISSPLTSSPTKTVSTTQGGVIPPGPTQTGIISTCNKYAIPDLGQGCWDFAAAHQITLDELYAWNPAIGQCSAFLAGEAYCIGVSASSKRSDDSYTHLAKLERRADCTTIKVVQDDLCGALADRCKITLSQFEQYNPDICNKLVVGQRVCCSAGTLPDIAPKPYANGSCYTYTVQPHVDNCATIGATFGLTNEKIENFNNKTTWGWFGCQNVPALLSICLSTGKPPLPNSVKNAQCGPLVPGTQIPTNGTAITDLNPCPLNACCNMWGQCGITLDYCTNHTGPAGNPGTAPKDENGCISNCGTDIVKGNGPRSFVNIGYYESWNWDRPCLNMRAASIDSSKYTHIHWAFATVSSSWGVSINDTYSQWKDFKNLPVKRIISFGGWGYSTEPATYDRLRQAMSPANRGTFITNIVSFVDSEGLDGVDFDWEYPGASIL
jgi:hypothetical protein